eukprot:CAMPEP_0183367816 /NCGR_PEP_ID=MMETSP0164_2-20130417/93751_1 /TAXON_ID=221442 /ORGANISM="Coccolithus pelagicus ssp braarudi, Strain PLY182g" /LENGTH=198 /DNA_ID=CAMNT_0025543807 /DNA_START=156 /DNA_END=752 /DNA_ORIENTATION=+
MICCRVIDRVGALSQVDNDQAPRETTKPGRERRTLSAHRLPSSLPNDPCYHTPHKSRTLPSEQMHTAIFMCPQTESDEALHIRRVQHLPNLEARHVAHACLRAGVHLPLVTMPLAFQAERQRRGKKVRDRCLATLCGSLTGSGRRAQVRTAPAHSAPPPARYVAAASIATAAMAACALAVAQSPLVTASYTPGSVLGA